jgi:hypothetical protein
MQFIQLLRQASIQSFRKLDYEMISGWVMLYTLQTMSISMYLSVQRYHHHRFRVLSTKCFAIEIGNGPTNAEFGRTYMRVVEKT